MLSHHLPRWQVDLGEDEADVEPLSTLPMLAEAPADAVTVTRADAAVAAMSAAAHGAATLGGGDADLEAELAAHTPGAAPPPSKLLEEVDADLEAELEAELGDPLSAPAPKATPID